MNQKLYIGNTTNGASGLNRQPPRQRGEKATGRIVRLLVGQGHGFIRLPDGREVYFHRADLADGTSFNGFCVGDAVRCEVLEDRFSGARALYVRRR